MKLDASIERKHTALWRWLAKNPTKNKWDWPHFKEMKDAGIELPKSNCFLCGSEKYKDCLNTCPLSMCQSGSKIYIKWLHTKIPEDRKRFALMIANCFKTPLPKEEVF